jgi:hypothetical protein
MPAVLIIFLSDWDTNSIKEMSDVKFLISNKMPNVENQITRLDIKYLSFNLTFVISHLKLL